MSTTELDLRNPERRKSDAKVAAEPPWKPLILPSDTRSAPVEAHLGARGRHPVAVAGVVENGLVRPLDPKVKLPEHSRVIIVASDQT